MTNATQLPGLVLVANSPQLYDDEAPTGAARLALDVVSLVGAAALAYGLSFATRVTRRR
ncbi:hypothetical protein [Agreia sp. COWG]|uniref:hypothetical protein n=1 Tax=Agreia sp. COWG TaxID=2773266 RepID=UPI001926E0C4|nr:hypothetical protein [Agreia sp. COWG]CAD5991092.1 protein of unknown function [Agreia sp. COWG]